jgi:hypothetical protein
MRTLLLAWRPVLLASAVCLSIAACASSRSDADRSGPPGDGEGGGRWLVDRTAALGLDFVHHSGEQGRKWLPMVMGPGVALFDADGDGDLDLYLANGNDWRPEGPASGESRHVNRFYRQVQGRFEDATDQSGLGDELYGQGLATGDVDNDGDIDVYVANFGPDRLYLNDGGGRFERASASAGVDVDGDSSSAVLCDFDRDGWLDIFVTRYVAFDPDTQCIDPDGDVDFCSPQAFDGLDDVLLRNEGGGRFRDASDLLGDAFRAAPGLGVVCEDLDENGWPDFLVANDGVANHLWLNQSGTGFKDLARLKGLAFDRFGQPEAGMGVVVADLDGDGRRDAFMTHLQGQKNTFYRNRGPEHGFQDQGFTEGLTRPSVAYTGFGVAALDLELDGDLDLAVVNGRVRSFSPALPGASLDAPWDRLAEPNQVYLARGDGAFEILAPERCGFCDELEVSRGLAQGDLDGDGDEDLVLTNIEGPARILTNVSPRRGRWLRVRAVDPALGGRDALGARIELPLGERRLVRTLSTGHSYRSASEPVATFGIPEGEAPAALEIQWPDGLRETFALSCLDCVMRVERGSGISLRQPPLPSPLEAWPTPPRHTDTAPPAQTPASSPPMSAAPPARPRPAPPPMVAPPPPVRHRAAVAPAAHGRSRCGRCGCSRTRRRESCPGHTRGRSPRRATG